MTEERKQEILEIIRNTNRRPAQTGKPLYPEEIMAYPNLCEEIESISRTVDGFSYRMDILRAKNRGKNCPLFINIHGGGFIGPHRENDTYFSAYMADQIHGIAVDLDYTLSDAAPYPVALHQCMDALDYVAEHIHAGITTEQIDLWVYEQTTHRGGIPAPLNYEGFPKSVCTSVNDQVCHGIPSADVILKDGDIINVDVSTIYNGYFSDSSRMFCIGEVSPEKKRLVEVTKQSIDEGLKHVKPWGHLGDMGQAIHDYATANGYTVVREIGGHGIGLEFHEDPWVSFVSKKGTEMLMVPGMIFTIEPMINMGKADIFVDAENDWTVYTDDGMPSAQWEIQVLITEDGYEILSW